MSSPSLLTCRERGPTFVCPSSFNLNSATKIQKQHSSQAVSHITQKDQPLSFTIIWDKHDEKARITIVSKRVHNNTCPLLPFSILILLALGATWRMLRVGYSYKYCCQAQIQNMNGSSTESRQVHTRSSARMFGLDLTNCLPERNSDPKRPKNKRQKPSLSTQWLYALPEVHPYLVELQLHARTLEHEGYIASDFMAWRAEISPRMREVLVGWMVEMHLHLCGNQHTLYLAVLITDKFCLGRSITRDRYQLLGIAALFVAAKYEEIKTPKLRQYSSVCGGVFSVEQILAMESEILLSLSFGIKAMTSCWHLEEHFQFAGLDPDSSLLCLYLLDLSLVEYGFCLLRPSLLSWGIVLFVIRTRQLPEVCEGEVGSTFHLAASELREVAQLVENLYRNRRHGKFKQVNEKHLPRLHWLIS